MNGPDVTCPRLFFCQERREVSFSRPTKGRFWVVAMSRWQARVAVRSAGASSDSLGKPAIRAGVRWGLISLLYSERLINRCPGP